MTTSTANEIIKTIINWQLLLSGNITKQEMPKLSDLKDYSLKELLEANQIIKEINQSKINAGNGMMTIRIACEDRLIAAVYVLMHYDASGGAIAMMDDKILGIVGK